MKASSLVGLGVVLTWSLQGAIGQTVETTERECPPQSQLFASAAKSVAAADVDGSIERSSSPLCRVAVFQGSGVSSNVSSGDVQLKLNPASTDTLGFTDATPTVYYHQGPLLAPADRDDIPDYTEWASFATEVTRKGVPGGVMPGRTAIAAGHYGKGRVLAISPHPEKTEGLDHVVPRAARWAANLLAP